MAEYEVSLLMTNSPNFDNLLDRLDAHQDDVILRLEALNHQIEDVLRGCLKPTGTNASAPSDSSLQPPGE